MAASRRLIPAEIVWKLTEGSYESWIERVQKLVDSAKVQLFGESGSSTQATVQATYEGHAIVLSDHPVAAVLRVYFAETEAGSLKLVRHEVVPVPTYDKETLPDFVHEESKRVVDLLLNGDAAGAVERLEGLAPLMTGLISESAFVDRVSGYLQEPRAWRRAISEKPEVVTRLLGDALAGLEKHRLLPKFGALVKGSLPEGDRTGYRDLVREDFEALLTRYGGLKAGVDSVRATVRQQVEALRARGVSPALDVFESLAEDLSADLKDVRRQGREAARTLQKVESLAKLYDTLAEALHSYEVATLFVTRLSQRIAQVAG